MAEESDWELVSDTDRSDPSAKVRVEFPLAGVLPHQNSSESPKTSSSSVNSFSIIEGIDTLGVQSHTGSSISSNYQPSSNESCVGSSICGQFDLISLSSGEVFFRCKACKGRNPVGTGICITCGLAQVPNPCIEVDQQIALAQQQRENKMALEALEFDEQQLQNLMGESLPNKATFLALRLAAQLEAHKPIVQDFEEMDVVNRTYAFLEKAYALHASGVNLDLTSGYVVTDQAEEISVRLRGFGDMDTHVSRTIMDALEYGPQFPSTSLAPISENEVMQKPLTSVWIVAVVGSKPGYDVYKRDHAVPGDTVLPLACLETKDLERKSERIDSLTKVLFQVIDDTFIDGLHLKEHSVFQSSTFAPVQKATKPESKSQSQPESGHKRNNPDQPWQNQEDYLPKVARKSVSQDTTPSSCGAGSIKPARQDTIDSNRGNRFGILSFFIAGGSMDDLEGLEHDTRTSLRLNNVPTWIGPEELLREFARQGFHPVRFNVFFLPTKPGYRPGILFLDFVDYKDIPQFCHLFCTTKSKGGFCLQPQYTRNQGKAALTAYFERSPLGYNPTNLDII